MAEVLSVRIVLLEFHILIRQKIVSELVSVSFSLAFYGVSYVYHCFLI